MIKVLYLATQHTTQDDAVLLAQFTIDQLFDRETYVGHTFDRDYLRQIETDTHIVDRTGKLRVAVPVDSQAGEQLLTQEWEVTQRELYESVVNNNQQNNSSEDKQATNILGCAVKSLNQIAHSERPAILLCNHHGVVIPSANKTSRMLNERQDLWIVPVEIHG